VLKLKTDRQARRSSPHYTDVESWRSTDALGSSTPRLGKRLYAGSSLQRSAAAECGISPGDRFEVVKHVLNAIAIVSLAAVIAANNSGAQVDHAEQRCCRGQPDRFSP
jgi:hypothetical protein